MLCTFSIAGNIRPSFNSMFTEHRMIATYVTWLKLWLWCYEVMLTISSPFPLSPPHIIFITATNFCFREDTITACPVGDSVVRFTLTRTGVVSNEGCVSLTATDGTAESELLVCTARFIFFTQVLSCKFLHFAIFLHWQVALTSVSLTPLVALRQTRGWLSVRVYSFWKEHEKAGHSQPDLWLVVAIVSAMRHLKSRLAAPVSCRIIAQIGNTWLQYSCNTVSMFGIVPINKYTQKWRWWEMKMHLGKTKVIVVSKARRGM